jgi:hypothetical protein
MLRQLLLKRVVLSLSLCAVLSAGVYASRTTYHPIRIPGVNRHGNLDLAYGGLANVKLVYSTHDRTFCATARTYVLNLSGHRQVYYNRLAVGLRHLLPHRLPPSAVTITEDRYVVEQGSHPLALHARPPALAHAIICGHVGGGGNPD